MPATAMLVRIWDFLTVKINTRSRKIHETPRITIHASTYLADEIKDVGKYSSSNKVAVIQVPRGASRIVNLKEGTCTYFGFSRPSFL